MLVHHESLSKYTSWRIGGPAKNLFIPESLDDLTNFLKSLPVDEKIFWIGLGSNLLIRDGGFDGTVIITQGSFLNKIESLGDNVVKIYSGTACGTVARTCARMGLTGIEFLAGVPGTMGGALAMNAGAHGGETWNYVVQCETINRRGEIKLRPASDYQFSYRNVITPEEDEWFIAGYLKLIPGDKETSLKKIKDLLEHRANTQPINLPNCGSVFRNPPNNYAAKLIENCGLKGHKIGGAEVSPKHANFIINTGSATAQDIEQLITHIANTVKQKHNVDLIREVHIIGEKTP
ncbi:MAG: UDP-N-acetylmuramate dehydrogenase [Gammaproteobacteria bacterium]|nr:UDP-N-acetylmuramate dehydrogenase [Gammaproteobacteria bacterium]